MLPKRPAFSHQMDLILTITLEHNTRIKEMIKLFIEKKKKRLNHHLTVIDIVLVKVSGHLFSSKTV